MIREGGQVGGDCRYAREIPNGTDRQAHQETDQTGTLPCWSRVVFTDQSDRWSVTLRKHRITPETLALYQRACEFYDSAIPVDPGLRQYRQQSCIDTALALHQALGRSPSQQCVMNTIGLEQVPADVLCHGEAAVADWVSARDLSRVSNNCLRPNESDYRDRLSAIAILGMKSGDTQMGVTTVLGLTLSRARQYWLYGFLQLLNIFLSSAFVDNQIQVLVRPQIEPEGKVSCC